MKSIKKFALVSTMMFLAFVLALSVGASLLVTHLTTSTTTKTIECVRNTNNCTTTITHK